MHHRWQFEQDDHARWRWKRLDGERGDVDSAASFADATACMLDAVRYVIRRRRARHGIDADGHLQ